MEKGTFDTLHAARIETDLSVEELWIRYFGLGGDEDPIDVDGYLVGIRELSRQQHNLLALALNERFLELGGDHPMPYLDAEGETAS